MPISFPMRNYPYFIFPPIAKRIAEILRIGYPERAFLKKYPPAAKKTENLREKNGATLYLKRRVIECFMISN